ncbi:hypothetical protein BpHYR1_013123 [Brachionus plicatilis]|uniref:Uncharacterized protein n=1 Tax=Brachionus plicatilis TaxID=10195 RepID=A0A3M7Q894_BRAPC|nr:hypothetical protein BpHYR1_013123 [Brachionus plicatilis]
MNLSCLWIILFLALSSLANPVVKKSEDCYDAFSFQDKRDSNGRQFVDTFMENRLVLSKILINLLRKIDIEHRSKLKLNDNKISFPSDKMNFKKVEFIK